MKTLLLQGTQSSKREFKQAAALTTLLFYFHEYKTQQNPVLYLVTKIIDEDAMCLSLQLAAEKLRCTENNADKIPVRLDWGNQ